MSIAVVGSAVAVWAEQPLFVAYPPDGHETIASQIFLIGTAPAAGTVTVNGQAIERSPAGHFAPSVPLQLGENVVTLRYQEQALTLRIIRLAADPAAPVGETFAEGSLTPAVDVARMPGELFCFGVIAPANATVAVTLADQRIPLLPQPNFVTLPPNSAVLTAQNQPVTATAQQYQGCTVLNATGLLIYGNNIVTGTVVSNAVAPVSLGQPEYELRLDRARITQRAAGSIELLSPTQILVVEVTADSGTARTGPSTDYSRLTPLPRGTRSRVTGREGDWLRLDYGAWIRASETQTTLDSVPPRSIIRSITSRQSNGWTEILLPLQVPVPVSVQQRDDTLTLTLHNTIAQTDTIFLNDDPVIERLDWQQVAPEQVQYIFNLKSSQQWGYQLRYEGTTLVLALRQPPEIRGQQEKPLAGARILLDPGHGGAEDLGARGPTGYPEKDVVLIVSNLLRDRLIARGATVYMTRDSDIDVPLQDRVNLIHQLEPTIALSLHYNALPDNGDAINTAGVSTFWYNAQAHSLAVFLHNHLVETLDRPSYGVFWNNLALTRPTVAPAVLLELGFMINPVEFEWIVDPQEQERLAEALAEGITQWLAHQGS
jgi:N-acetylmuramoyl-L-alanine amidase